MHFIAYYYILERNLTILKDAVQPTAWFNALPRKEYENYKHVMTYNGWYEVYDLGTQTYAIYEPGHFQEVISYLILGNEKALLLDTGMGICPIKPLVEELTDLPITVVNSHCHFDHIGGNWEFDFVYIFDYPASLDRLNNGMETKEVLHHLRGDSTWIPYPDGFKENKYSIKPGKCKGIQEGYIFDLGGRVLEVLHTPGHSPDSIMLLDSKYSILFTGDTFYPATMYAHLGTDDGINSVFGTYLQTMVSLAEKIKVDYLYTCHNYPVVNGSVLKDVAEAFKAIATDKLSYLTDEENLKKYQFDGFAIVCK